MSDGPRLRSRRGDELTAAQLHALLRLRVDVFVVEQACPYPEVDGRDLLPTTRHLWLEERGVVTALRVVADDTARRVGRVVTRTDARGRGLASRLLDEALATTAPPWVLDAQTASRALYERHGFVVVGEEFLEDGIPHVPMRRAR